ncbi:MAG: cytochrome P450 [Sphingomonadaceae bacterium]
MKTVDPESPEALADRPAFHNMLRDKCPVARSADGQYYYVAGYDNVKEVLDNHGHFSKEWGSQLAKMERHVALNQDPPDFSAFRRIYTAYMSPAGVRRWADDCARIAHEVIDRFIDLGSGDLQPLFGKPVPAMVTARALGFPENQVDRYRRWTDAFLDAMIRDPEEQKRVIEEIYAFFDEQFEQKRQQLKVAGIEKPGKEHVGTVIDDSLTSVLIATPYQGRYLTNDELRRTVRGFFIGGVDTTGALMLNTLHHLLKQRDLWEQVRQDPALVDVAIEESLRLEPPAMGMFRGTTCPVEMAGETIPEDSRVLFSVLSANRDPARFEDPDSFRLDRGANRHIAFGSGAHFCPGAWTARMEAAIALKIFIERLPKLRLTGPVSYYDAINFWIVRSFPAAWD